MRLDRKKHWESVYETKNPDQVSWTQETPKTSLEFIHSFGLNKSAKIIDVGGGDSKLVDHLLEEGFNNITVLDISERAMCLFHVSKWGFVSGAQRNCHEYEWQMCRDYTMNQ